MMNTDEKSKTELTILIGLAHGYRTSQISEHLGFDNSTAYRALERLRARLGAKTNMEALAIAMDNKLIQYGTFTL